MKRVVSFLLIGIMLSLCLLSMADTTVTLKPGPDDLTHEYLRNYAATFYARKCGLSRESLMEARMEMALWQSDRIRVTEEGKKVWELVGEPEWYIHVQSFPGENGQHEGFHMLSLTREGELISWSAHGGEHFVEDPDMMQPGSPATPLPTDAKEDDILSKAHENLKTLYGIGTSDTLRFKTAFITHELFNGGKLPVWLVDVYEEDVKTWKGLYSYKGQLLSLVPAQQDYTNYVTPDEWFFRAVYGNDDMDKTVEARFGYIPEAEIIAWLKEVGPKYEAPILFHKKIKREVGVLIFGHTVYMKEKEMSMITSDTNQITFFDLMNEQADKGNDRERLSHDVSAAEHQIGKEKANKRIDAIVQDDPVSRVVTADNSNVGITKQRKKRKKLIHENSDYVKEERLLSSDALSILSKLRSMESDQRTVRGLFERVKRRRIYPNITTLRETLAILQEIGALEIIKPKKVGRPKEFIQLNMEIVKKIDSNKF